MKITLCNKKILIDKEDAPFVIKHSWSVYGNSCGQKYFVSGSKGERVVLHRAIINCPDGMVADHISGNFLDNRKENLRICTLVQNIYNQKKHKGKRHSKYKGVTFRKDLVLKPWEAFIYNNRKSRRLGYYKTEEEAALAYNQAAEKSYGEFARLNDVKEV